MAQQEKEQSQRRNSAQVDERVPNTQAVVKKGKELRERIDEVAAEVDRVLEGIAQRKNFGSGEEARKAAAEEFVGSFVQRGGE
ncbi:ubiquitin-like protein Pup [Candidatus Parcubacteria bacterium]|nr:ubiquitin-like protein Pup [Candidatus Parcubacteria bacterium]